GFGSSGGLLSSGQGLRVKRTSAGSAEGVAKEEVSETPLEAFASLCMMLVVYLFVIGFMFQNFAIPSPSMQNTLLVGDHLLVDRTTLAPAPKWMPLVPYRAVQRGDIIVFMKPHTEVPDMILVKRAIGIPGDRIHLRKGVVYVNGVAQTEPYAIQPSETDLATYRDDFPSDLEGLKQYGSYDLSQRGECQNQACVESETIDRRVMDWAEDLPKYIQGDDLVVPPGMVFAMGDNRTHSLDGRFWGFVPQQNILGRPLIVYWSFKTPDDQGDKTSTSDKLKFLLFEATHFFDETRWGRTFHVTR
ncbi:signal peptidase I, partial [Bradyrhizobium sp.]|uniref:signal peptidase I n=1 Tax=Bradyrhizobium sp. TaxID=376 RepID=UPI003C38BD72